MIFLGKTEIASNTDVKTHVPKIACTLKILTSENFLLIPGFLKCLLMKNPKIVVETCLTFISTNFGTQISGLLPTSYNMSKYLVLKSSDSTTYSW